MMQPSLKERFWAKVDKGKPDECWEWQGARTTSGYGTICNRKPQGTHRTSWELHNGPIPKGMYILHACDNPPCVNPSHLKIGTPADNMADKIAKMRKAKEAAPLAPELCSADLTLQEYLRTVNQYEAAAALGVTQGAISQMAASDREIRIVTDIDGAVIRTYEVKSVGKKKIA